jgi:hypothetical protein
MEHLPELPQQYQNRFEALRAKAELEYATRGERFRHQPQVVDSGLHLVLLIHKVFFGFCAQARNAYREGHMSVREVSSAVEVAWPRICDHYFVRERGVRSEEHISPFRFATRRTVTDDAQWKQHLSDLLALAEGIREVAGPPESEGAGEAEPPVNELGENLNVPAPVDQHVDEVGRSAMANLCSWKNLKAEFEKGAQEYDNLSANRDSLRPGIWTLGDGAGQTLDDRRAQRKFEELGGAAATLLGPVRVGNDLALWQSWLEYLYVNDWRAPAKESTQGAIPQPRRVPFPVARIRAEQAGHTLWRVFQVSADCCQDFAEGEEPSRATNEPPATSESHTPPNKVPGDDSLGATRRAKVDAYIDEVFRAAGKRITRTDFWRAARYATRTEFERWERDDPKKRNRTADQRFTQILAEKPHLK